MAMVAIESHDLPCIGRLSGADVRSWLSEGDALWTRARATTGLDEWLATMSANIEKRRRHVA